MITVKFFVCEHERGIRSFYDCIVELGYVPSMTRQSYVLRPNAYVCMSR